MPASPTEPRERGQIIILFALFLASLLAMGSLLYTGAETLVLRRQLQNAGDAAALAAANLMVNGTGNCTAARISSTATDGSNDLYLAAKASVQSNLGWSSAKVTSHMTVTCSTNADYAGRAVVVSLTGTSAAYFGPVSLDVATSSTAMNGQTGHGDFSVALLDPSNPNWRANRNGCPSFLINGGPTVTFEGSIFVDSTCLRSENTNAAMKAVNNSFQMLMVNNSTIRVAGEIAAGTGSHITPSPVEKARPIQPDPLSGLVKPCNAVDPATNCLGTNATLPSVNMSGTGTGICKNQDPCIITPGTYSNGIQAGGGGNIPNTVLMRPGVYVIRGNGLTLKSASGRIFSIPAGNSSTGYTNAQAKADFSNSKTQLQVSQQWMSVCPTPTVANPESSTCGVMIYNAPSSATSNWNTNNDQIKVGAQGIFQVRAYNPDQDTIVANRTLFRSYKNISIWQARNPAPSGSGSTQPNIVMNGGACVTLSGTVYAPGALVDFGGGSCGSGGGDDKITMQFICWDLTLEGNNAFYFQYQKDWFAQPTTYGLVQ
jgi:hypothetical protein